jgi:Tfp pilus assembly protein PilE
MEPTTQPPETPSTPEQSTPSAPPPPQFQSSSVTAAPAQPQNPGKGLAIAGLILAFVPIPLVGLILSIIALVKSLSGSSTRIMAIIGLILNVISAILVAILALIVMVAYNGVQGRAQTQAGLTASYTVQKHVLAYAAENNHLPVTVSEVGNVGTGITLGAITSQPADYKTVEYAICNDGDTARFGYWDFTESVVKYQYIGQSGSTEASTDCKVVK